MNNLYKKLNTESEHVRLTLDEKRAMRTRIFGTPSPVTVTHSPYVFVASHRFMMALAALVIVVLTGGSTAAYAAQGALPGDPLYTLKTAVLEPVAVALASTPADKAAVHVALAERRVEEAETLAQKGALTATTSAELAANFESHAQSADAIADDVATSDPAVSVQIKTQLDASSAVGGAVLVALANGSTNSQGKQHADDLALRVASRHESSRTLAVAATRPKATATVRTFAAVSTDTGSGSTTDAVEAQTAAVNPAQQNIAGELEEKAQKALTDARQQYAAASSSLDASTTVSVQNSLDGISALIGEGSTALGSSAYDTATADFTEALLRSVKLIALLKAQIKFDNHIITPLLQLNGESDTHGGD